MLSFSKCARAAGNVCRIGTLTGGLPQPTREKLPDDAAKRKANLLSSAIYDTHHETPQLYYFTQLIRAPITYASAKGARIRFFPGFILTFDGKGGDFW